MLNCEWPVFRTVGQGIIKYITSLFLLVQRLGITTECLLRVKWSAQGPHQVRERDIKEFEKIDRYWGRSSLSLSLSPLPWEAWEACGINVIVSHVFIALCSDVVGRCALSPSADVKNKLTRRQLYDFVLAVTEFPWQHDEGFVEAMKLQLTFSNYSYSVHVQRVDGEVVWVHAELVEDFLESDFLTVFLQNHSICFGLVCFLYKFQQVLLVHATSSMYMCVHLCWA